MKLRAKVGSDPCEHCGSKGCAVYARGDVRFGCAKCVGGVPRAASSSMAPVAHELLG